MTWFSPRYTILLCYHIPYYHVITYELLRPRYFETKKNKSAGTSTFLKLPDQSGEQDEKQIQIQNDRNVNTKSQEYKLNVT